MLVYGDRIERRKTATIVAEMARSAGQVQRSPPGLARHGQLASLLIEAGCLVQGLADAAFETRGADDPDDTPPAAMLWLKILAEALARSWRSGFQDLAPLPACFAPLTALPDIAVRTPEGFGFYAAYPEAWLEAGAATGGGAATRVLGLRSIGVTLAAMAGAGARTADMVTVRPTGPPFAREIRSSPALRTALAGDATWLVADEGPGLSGSSFAAAARLLLRSGAREDRIVFLPSHDGPPGRAATPEDVALWRRMRRLSIPFEDLWIRQGPCSLSDWFADLVGPATAPLEDLSAGRWRNHLGVVAPAAPGFERRKYLLRTAQGEWLLRFVGLGRFGEKAFADASLLADAGFANRPIALRHGFTVEPWLGEARTPDIRDRRSLLPALARYLAFRARRMPAAPESGASVEALRQMATTNLAELAASCAEPPPPTTPLPVVRVDGRLHRWEWLRLSDGRLLKTDAVDHCRGHDLVGCQPIAWDLAGAIVEFGLTGDEATALVSAVEPRAASSLPFWLRAYCAFQAGLWTEAAQPAEARRYLQALRDTSHA